MVRMTEMTDEMVNDIKKELDVRCMGDGMPDSWVPEGMKGMKMSPSKLAKMSLPAKLQKYIRDMFGNIKAKDFISELKSYKNPPPAVLQVMQGTLLILHRFAALKVHVAAARSWRPPREAAG